MTLFVAIQIPSANHKPHQSFTSEIRLIATKLRIVWKHRWRFLLTGHRFGYTRCLSDTAVAKFKEVISSAFYLLPCLNITEDSYANFCSSQIDHVDSAADPLRMKLDSVAL